MSMATRSKNWSLQARIVIAHGQMHAEDIDSAFHKFKSGEADILIATTIVENGIDIPNANTILIDNADKLGIADLVSAERPSWPLEPQSLLLLLSQPDGAASGAVQKTP